MMEVLFTKSHLGQGIRWNRVHHRVWFENALPYFTPGRANVWKSNSNQVVVEE
jgi:hypothetical protein